MVEAFTLEYFSLDFMRWSLRRFLLGGWERLGDKLLGIYLYKNILKIIMIRLDVTNDFLGRGRNLSAIYLKPFTTSKNLPVGFPSDQNKFLRSQS